VTTEHSEQQGFVIWWRHRYPDVLLFAIPNGGIRHIATGKALKDEGVVAGIPDLFAPRLSLWVEMKTTTGTLSVKQERIISYLRRIGHTVIVGYGAEDASRQVLEFMGKMP
jgi:hypothetical protein